jgi:ribosomal protein S18 acetylase RimI-like enzyme
MSSSESITIVQAESQDLPFLRKMLYEAIFIPPGEVKPEESIIDDPRIIKYIQDWKLPSDCGCIASVEGTAIGAAWSRLLNPQNPGYGYVAPHIPELCMAVLPEYRAKGIGTLLLENLFQQLQSKGYPQLSLSVDRRNRAVYFYLRSGFTLLETREMDFVMIRDLDLIL